ncbi:olfactory receptor 12D3-like [Rhinatrema bivittatum]|uniref:olfactory receptor 12D3-like n=1 Tax=Rhinatrema bivittatum TaxID=194408 RepID=UPI00112E346F|nr:olfactory receptor 12D3-like [Rhinatrema bivittatum]
MEAKNQTEISDFILLGLTTVPNLKKFLFVQFSIFYLITILGNSTIIMLVITSSRLHTPMYYLLANLSFLDICFSSVTVPNMLVGFLSERQSIAFPYCVTQLHFFHFVGSTEGIILTVMSFDRYVAICNPFKYSIIMNKKVCILLISGSWIAGFLHAMIHAIVTSWLHFCKSNEIRHFFCDIKPLLNLACSNTQLNELLLTIMTGFIAISSFLLTVISYIYIGSTILKFRSAQERHKAFSTCASHLTVVLLFYGTANCTYLRPISDNSLQQDRVAAILFTVFTPALNPLIYTLRNQEVKSSLKKVVHRNLFPKRL